MNDSIEINFNEDLRNKIEILSRVKCVSPKDYLLEIIRVHVLKQAKAFGLDKQEHKLTVAADNDVLETLLEAVKYYETLPLSERKHLSPINISRYIIANGKKQKNIAVIKRFLASERAFFINDYHLKNNLKPSKRGRKPLS